MAAESGTEAVGSAALELIGFHGGPGRTRVLDDIDLRLPRGARLALLGRNGAGKTTLIRAVMGLAACHAGRIELAGIDISAWAAGERARAGLGYVPQTREIFASLSVEDNLALALRGRPRAALDEAYALFPRLAERRGHAGSHLSGGEQQMLAIGRAVLTRPRILLLDEPLEGLAPLLAEDMMAALAVLARSRELTILLAEQQIDRALAFADRAAILERGRIVWAGDAELLAAQAGILHRHLGLDIRRADCFGSAKD